MQVQGEQLVLLGMQISELSTEARKVKRLQQQVANLEETTVDGSVTEVQRLRNQLVVRKVLADTQGVRYARLQAQHDRAAAAAQKAAIRATQAEEAA